MWESFSLLSNKSSLFAYIRWPVPDGPYLTRIEGLVTTALGHYVAA